MPPSTQEYKRGSGNSQGNLMKCWGGRSSYEVLSPIFTRLWTFFTSTEFFLYWHKVLHDATVGIVSEIMVRMYDTTVDNYNFNSGEKLYPSRFFLFVCECNLAQVAPCHFLFRICLEEWLWYCPCVTKSSPSAACAVSYAALSSKVIIMFDE